MDDHEDSDNPSDIPNEPPSGEHDVEAAFPAPEVAPDPLQRVTAERDRMREQLLRTAADFENFRKRALRDVHDRERRAREDTIREFLPIVDNLERAVSTSAEATELETVVDGVRMVLKLFDDVGERMSLTRVPTVGERFDPNLHDALQQVERDDIDPGTIVAELVPGYRVGERLLRPAMVVVARPPSGGDDEDAPAAN